MRENIMNVLHNIVCYMLIAIATRYAISKA